MQNVLFWNSSQGDDSHARVYQQLDLYNASEIELHRP